jgi:16S rRNA processing protein RimM
VSSKSSNNKLKYTRVGWVKDAHGLRGELFVRLQAKTADWLTDDLTLHLEKEGGLTAEFSVEKAKPFKDGLIVKLEGMNDRTAAEGWKRAQVSIPAELLVAEPGERVFLEQLMGFSVLDGGVVVGRVVGFGTNGSQDLLRVDRGDGREALVPLVDDFIERLDFDNGQIHMTLPPGLLDVDQS